MLAFTRLRVLLVLAVLAIAPVAAADDVAPAPTTESVGSPVKTARQGVAVIGMGGARDEAFQLARGIYGSTARPGNLDEVRARILAGDPPGNASKDLRDLAELRAGVTGEDAASRQLLTSLAQKLNVQALLVVHKSVAPATAGPAPASAPAADGDAGAAAPGTTTAAVETPPVITARLFLAETGDFDAANYSPEAGEPGTSPWAGTVRSVTTRFPAATGLIVRPRSGLQPTKLPADSKDSKPFWTSPWLWVGLGAAALAGVGLFFATRGDNSSAPIHLQLRVP